MPNQHHYLGFIHYFSSQSLISYNPQYLNDEFFVEKLTPEFKGLGTPFDCEKSFHSAVKDYCSFRLKELSELDLELDDRVTFEYLKQEPKILIEQETSDIEEVDLQILNNCDLPDVAESFHLSELPRTQFYLYLFKNLIIRMISKAVTNFEPRPLEDKRIPYFEFGNIKSEIHATFKMLNIEDWDPKKKYQVFYGRSLGIQLIWAFAELRELYELQSERMIKESSIEELYLAFPFDSIRNISWQENIIKLNERVIRRFIAQLIYSESKAVTLLVKSKERYLALKIEENDNKHHAKSKEQLIIHIQVLENLIFIKRNVSRKLDYPDLDFNQLIDSNISNRIYSEVKDLFSSAISKVHIPSERLEIISSQIRYLSFLQSPIDIDSSKYKNSIPRNFLNYLEILKSHPYPIKSNILEPNIRVLDDLSENGVKGEDARILNFTPSQKEAISHLDFFKGQNFKNIWIVEKKQIFERIKSYTIELIKTDTIPLEIVKIQVVNTSAMHIRFTYNLIFLNLYGTGKNEPSKRLMWAEFLHKLFGQFAGTTPEDIKAKFSVSPKNYINPSTSLRDW